MIQSFFQQQNIQPVVGFIEQFQSWGPGVKGSIRENLNGYPPLGWRRTLCSVT